MKIWIVVFNLFMYISITLWFVYLCILSLVHHFCVSNILQCIKIVNEMWWYKLLFLNFFVFEQTKIFIYKVKPKMFIFVIWLSLYFLFFFFFFSPFFNVFLLFVTSCAAPFVEHLRNGKKIYYKIYKRKRSNDIFTHGFFLLYRGLDSSILNLLEKIKTYSSL